MTHAKKYLVRLGGGLLLAATLVPMVPPTVEAQSVDIRVYDSHHRDYHNWDDHEDRAYRHYMEQRHIKYKEYQRQSSRRQRAYWEWRHSHPD
jgi:hypothetical protein